MAKGKTIGYAVRNTTGLMGYFKKRTGRNFILVCSPTEAKLYKTLREAEKQWKRLDGRGFKDRNGDAITFEVEEMKGRVKAA